MVEVVYSTGIIRFTVSPRLPAAEGDSRRVGPMASGRSWSAANSGQDRFRPLVRRLLVIAVLAPAGCGTLPQPPLTGHLQATGETASCARFYQAFSREVAAAGVRDSQSASIPGFPYLRVNRFLASFRGELTAAQQPVWLKALRQLGAEAERLELANLPATPALWQRLDVSDRSQAAVRLQTCGDQLLAVDRRDPASLASLRDRAVVPDAYTDTWRVLGLYPLTALPVSWGVADLHAAMDRMFIESPAPLSAGVERLDYIPPAAAASPGVENYVSLPRDPLGRRQLSAAQIESLFERHAPVWRIATATADDRIGTPYWQTGQVRVDTTQPQVYRKLSYTRWYERTLLQLNYIVWFPARPKTGSLDLLGGHLDGITWRVTLATDGEPLLYDVMHNCGCYHMAFPGARLAARDVGGPWNEPLAVPAPAPALQDDERIRLWIEQRTHYLQAIDTITAATGTVYRLADYRQLRSLPQPDGGHKSLFEEDGLVPGSERLERWLLWPMGVPEPGAMRQWGTHATAFVGKRHFDDPDLISRYFRPAYE